MHVLPDPPVAQGFILSPDLMGDLAPNISTALAFGGDLLDPNARGTLASLHAGLWAEFMRQGGTRPQVLTDFEHGALILAMCIVAGFTHIPYGENTSAHRLRRSAARCLADLTGPHSAEDRATWQREEHEYARWLLGEHPLQEGRKEPGA